MRPVIIDADTGRELWRNIDCAGHCGVTVKTWTNYVANGRTPAPVAQLDGKTNLWFADDIKTWHANRPGSPIPGAPTTGSKRV